MTGFLFIIVLIIILALDRVTKHYTIAVLGAGVTKSLIKGLVSLHYVENTGAAFSMLSEKKNFLTCFIFLAVICLTVYLIKNSKKSLFLNISLILIIAGGCGNLIDRLLYGFVVDFIDPVFVNFAVFNVADIAITVGAFLMAGYEIYGLVKECKGKEQ